MLAYISLLLSLSPFGDAIINGAES